MVKDKAPINEHAAIDILKQIIKGYDGLHQRGIVHRDLKPANIFFTRGCVKIADLGFAVKATELTKIQTYNVGSPVYMPYEALDKNQYSAKSDVWAIGVIFFEMLTGRTPWRAKSETDLKRQIKNIPIKSLIPIHISKIATEFLLKCLHSSVEDRFSP